MVCRRMQKLRKTFAIKETHESCLGNGLQVDAEAEIQRLQAAARDQPAAAPAPRTELQADSQEPSCLDPGESDAGEADAANLLSSGPKM